MSFRRHRFRSTTVWLIFLTGALFGLGLPDLFPPGSVYVALCGLLLWLSLRRRAWPVLLAALLFGMACGAWRGNVFARRLEVYDNFYKSPVSLIVRAKTDGIYSKNGQLAFDAGSLSLDGFGALPGQLQISGYGANAVFEGDIVEVTGKLYPGFGAYQGRVSFARINVLERHPALLSEAKRRFIAGTQSALPEPLAPFVMGLLVGQRANLPDSVKEDLKHVGLTHIIAVSGANLTIILRAATKLLGKRSKRLATGLTFSLIAAFLILSGASASIVRAAIVSMLSIIAAYYGRSFHPLNLIAFAAAVTAWANPVYIWTDISWYLSFLAFAGVMILSPLVQARWPARWHETTLGGVALESLCAETMTLPFVLYNFGQMSRVGLLANVLVVIFIPLAMLLGAIAGMAGVFMGSAAGWLSWPAALLLNYMLDMARLLAGLPHVFVENLELSLGQMLSIYACIAALITVLWFKNDRKSAIITDVNDSKTRGLLT